MTVRQLWRLWALLVVAVVLAWLAVEPSATSNGMALVSPRQAARLPQLPPPPAPADPAAAIDKLAQSALWGPPARAASGAAADDAPPPPKWALSGFVDVNGKRQVIVSFENLALPSRQLGVGDKLPDGSSIVAIEPDRLRVRAPRTRPPEGAASAPASGWLPITPGLTAPASPTRR